MTTLLEMEVGRDLCAMLGYTVPPVDVVPDASGPPVPWGHITCDGSGPASSRCGRPATSSTSRSRWRRAKGDARLKAARGLTTRLPDGSTAQLVSLDDWGLLNLGAGEILAYPPRSRRSSASTP